MTIRAPLLRVEARKERTREIRIDFSFQEKEQTFPRAMVKIVPRKQSASFGEQLAAMSDEGLAAQLELIVAPKGTYVYRGLNKGQNPNKPRRDGWF